MVTHFLNCYISRGPNTVTGCEWLSPQQTDKALWQEWDGVRVRVGVELEGGQQEQKHTGS